MEPMYYSSLLFSQHPGMFASASGLFSEASGTSPAEVTVTGEPAGIAEQFKSDGTRVVFIGTMDKLWRSDGSIAPVDVTGSTVPAGRVNSAAGALATRWSKVFWNDWCLATNGLDAPQVYKSGPTFVDLGTESQFTTAEIFGLLGPHVLAIGTDNNPKEVLWCAEGNPEAWNPTLYATAGQLVLRELAQRPMAAVPLGRALAVYGPGDMQLLNYIGSWGVIGQSTIALVGIGAVSKFSVVPVGARNYGLMRNRVFVTDGVGYQDLGDPALGTWLERNVNWDQAAKIWGYFSPANNVVRWSLPLVGSNNVNRVLTLHLENQTFSFNSSELAFNCASPPKEFGKPIMAKQNGQIVFGDSGYGYLGGALTRQVRTKWMDFGKRGVYKYVEKVVPDIRLISGSGPTLTVESRRDSTADAYTVGPTTLVDEENEYRIDAAGLFHRFTFASTGANDAWELGGFKVFGELDGDDVA